MLFQGEGTEGYGHKQDPEQNMNNVALWLPLF